MNRKQVFNPFLPLNECIPDGEPHVFGDRVYLYGSHDKEGGETFCMLDYVVYSAPIADLHDWRREGVIFRAEQDPDYQNRPYMYAPDVVRGNDGRYYLYYCMSGDYGQGGYHGPISVAVCDTPAGEYQYIGYVKNPDGSPMLTYVCFDPAVINDDGVIRIYYGTQYSFEEDDDFHLSEEHLHSEMGMFHKTAEEILGTPESVMGPSMVTVGDDMMTITSKPCHVIPYAVKGTTFEEHPFFEGSSIRKIKDTYYFIYSSMKNHELCYATSKYPDRDYVFGGTIVSNGDVGMHGRKDEDRLNMTGTTHGSIEKIGEDYYIFYHRLTHKSDYSRQACAQKIKILPDGSIPQVEITSCGFDQEYLQVEGSYPAVIACNITNGNMPHGSNRIFDTHFPNVTNSGEERYIGEIADGTLIGYKYFAYPKDSLSFKITYTGTGEGKFYVLAKRLPATILKQKDMCDYIEQNANGELVIIRNSDSVSAEVLQDGETHQSEGKIAWKLAEGRLTGLSADGPLYLVYRGSGEISVQSLIFES